MKKNTFLNCYWQRLILLIIVTHGGSNAYTLQAGSGWPGGTCLVTTTSKGGTAVTIKLVTGK